jgi:kynureninase
MHTNISLLQAILVSCFDFSARRNGIVCVDMEFPSVLYVYRKLAAAQGARLSIVRSPDGVSVGTQDVLRAINERTCIVPISHVLFRSACIQDVKAIVKKAHACGAIVILDAYHSVGILPLDVHDLGVDVLIGGVLKWLCGGPGGAFLWIRPSLRKKLSPKITGWMAHKEPFAFAPTMNYRDDAFRFLNGTPSIPALYAGTEGARIISRVGIKRIRQKSLRQTSIIIDEAQKMGLRIATPLEPGRRGGTVTLKVPHGYEVAQELLRRNIVVDFRKNAGIRIAPHFYNSDEEVRSAMGQLGEILSNGAWHRHARKHSLVT